MKRRIASAVLGVLLGLALLAPIQAERIAMAICSNDAASIYETMNGVFPADYVEYVVEVRTYTGYTCDSAYVGGLVFDRDGFAVIAVVGETEFYRFHFDFFGGLAHIR